MNFETCIYMRMNHLDEHCTMQLQSSIFNDRNALYRFEK